MDTRLEEWCEHQRDFWSDLVTQDTGIVERWRALVERTTPHVDPRRPWQPHLEGASSFNPPGPHFTVLPAEIIDAWRAHSADWIAFARANPRVAIADIMIAISENSEGASWPWSREQEIERWVREGRPLSQNLTPNRHHLGDLAKAAKAAGPGWAYYDLERSRLTWR